MNIALIHEFLITWGGAEAVVKNIMELFPSATIFVPLYDKKKQSENFSKYKVVTSALQKLPFSHKFHRLFLFFYPFIFESFDLRKFDLVIISNHSFAKCVITPSTTCSICYCHTPMRFGWELYHEHLLQFPLLKRVVFSVLLNYLRLIDVISANRIDYFIANSKNTSKRIWHVYKRNSEVIYPPVEIDKFKISSKNEGFFLIVSRLVSYKKIDIAIKAFNELGLPLFIIGDGPEYKNLKKISNSNIKFFGFLPDNEVKEFYSKCKAFIFTPLEDFGITPIEAQASGKPVIAFRGGGALETIIEGKTGIFFDEQTPESLIKSLERFKYYKFHPDEIRANAENFSSEKFKNKFEKFINFSYLNYKKG